MKTKIITASSFVLLILLIVFVFENAKSSPAVGAVTTSGVATLASSTQVTVGPAQATSVFAIRVFCTNRVISTKATGIMIGFGTTSTASNGIWQAASTTVSYEASKYGCGAVNAYGFTASSSLNVLEYIL